MVTKMWSEYYPEDCPPDEARHDQTEAYRLTNQFPPNAEDFLPTIVESPPHRKFNDEDLCNACGTSVFTNIKDIKKKRKRYKPLRNKTIVKGIINEEDGVILETYQKSHLTWWLETETPHMNFMENCDNE